VQDLVWLHSGMSATQWLTASFWLPAVYGLVAPVNSPHRCVQLNRVPASDDAASPQPASRTRSANDGMNHPRKRMARTSLLGVTSIPATDPALSQPGGNY